MQYIAYGHCLVILLFVFSVFWGTCSAGSTNYTVCEKPNDCTFVPGYPYCRNGRCSQCAPEYHYKDCECPVGQYCISDVDDVSSNSEFI
jgi:hypothetical protein